MAVALAIGRSDSAVKPQNMAVAPATERTTWPPRRLVRKIAGNSRQPTHTATGIRAKNERKNVNSPIG